MKFGKSIRAEARNNRGLSFVNFKHLKRLLKRCVTAVNSGSWVTAKELDLQFQELLESESQKVGESFWKELHQISTLQEGLQKAFPLLDLQPDPATYTNMSFEELQAHLQALGGLNEVPYGKQPSPSVRTSVALCEFCVNLGKISARSKKLRRGVLWNAVAIVKILKKRQKSMTGEALIKLSSITETSAQVLSRQDWYCCPELSRLVSIVETTTDELMQRLTLKPPSREHYQCPICLDVVLDPVCLRTCGHRFCWACLCMAYCEKPEGTLERCPICRAVFPLDPEAFEIDGILTRFLRTFFPDIQSTRIVEQQENIRQRLQNIRIGASSQKYSNDNLDNLIKDSSTASSSTTCYAFDTSSTTTNSGSTHSIGSSLMNMQPQPHILHCCPDCIINVSSPSLNGFTDVTEYTNDQYLLHQHLFEFNTNPLLLNSTTQIDDTCRHVQNVKAGKPADVDALAFAPSTTSMLNRFNNNNNNINHHHLTNRELLENREKPIIDIANIKNFSLLSNNDAFDHRSVVNSVVESLLVESPRLTTATTTIGVSLGESTINNTIDRHNTTTSPPMKEPYDRHHFCPSQHHQRLISMMEEHLLYSDSILQKNLLSPNNNSITTHSIIEPNTNINISPTVAEDGNYNFLPEITKVSQKVVPSELMFDANLMNTNNIIRNNPQTPCNNENNFRVTFLPPSPVFLPIYEAVDDDDDEIEAEFLLKQSYYIQQHNRSIKESNV